MKGILKTVLLIIIASFMIVCCQKEQNTTISVTIKNTDSYSKSFVAGDEEGAAIKVQAKHYENSEIVRDENTNFNAEYRYKPIPGFVGKDGVVLEVYHNGTGVGKADVQTVRIDFVISE